MMRGCVYQPFKARISTLLLTLALFMPVIANAPAGAQGTAGTLPDPIASDDLEEYGKVLGLSDDQMLSVGTHHEQYLAQFEELRKSRIEDFLQEVRSIQPTVMFGNCEQVKDLANKLDKLVDRIGSLDRRLFDRMQTVLTEQQLATLPRVREARQRERYRESVSRYVSFFNRSTRADFTEIIERIDLNGEQKDAIDPTLRRYERQLTSQLGDLHDAVRSMFVTMCEQVSQRGITPEKVAQSDDPEEEFEGVMRDAWAEASKDFRKVSAEISELNRRTLRDLSSMLDEPTTDRLRRSFIRRAYPRISDREITAARRFQAALDSDQVTGELRQSVFAASQQYRRQDRSMTQKMMDLTDELRAMRSPFNMWGDENSEMESIESQLEELEDRRESANDEAIASLESLLGQDLAKAIASKAGSRRTRDADGPRGRRGRRGDRDRDDEEDNGAGSAAPAMPNDRFIPKAISEQQIQQYAKVLELGEANQSVVQSFHSDYMTAYHEIQQNEVKSIESLREAMPSFRRRGEDEVEMTEAKINQLFEQRKAVFERVVQLDNKLFEDLALLASKESLQKLDELRADRKRQRYTIGDTRGSMRWMMRRYSDESGAEAGIDLTQLVDEVDFTEEQREAVRPALREYEKRMTELAHELYQTRLALAKVSAKWRLEAATGEGRNRWRQAQEKYGDLMEAVGERFGRATKSASQLNQQTLSTMRDQLSADVSRQLQYAYEREAYPEIFSEEGTAEPILKAVFDLPDLSEKQRSRMLEIASNYRRKFRELSREMVAVQREDTDSSDNRWRGRMKRRNDMRALRFQRDELTSATRRKIRAVLNDDQIQRIPPLREDEDD